MKKVSNNFFRNAVPFYGMCYILAQGLPRDSSFDKDVKIKFKEELQKQFLPFLKIIISIVVFKKGKHSNLPAILRMMNARG